MSELINEQYVIEHKTEQAYFRSWNITGISICIVSTVELAKKYDSETEAKQDFNNLLHRPHWQIVPVSMALHG